MIFLEGLVIKSTGSWYQVKLPNNKKVDCRLEGKMRLQGLKTTNPIAVGDKVIIEKEENQNTYMVKEIVQRNNYLIRQSPRNPNLNHIVASNIDMAFLVVTISNPEVRYGFIDRFLLVSEAYHIPTTLVVNKSDLHTEEDEHALAIFKDVYGSIGYPIVTVSALEGDGIDELKQMMNDNVNVFSGQSGVGKSSLINAICPEMEIKTLTLSNFNGKGQHTTTFAEMHELPFGGYIVDTPGIKQLGIVNVEVEEVSHYFKEMLPHIDKCKFADCMHLNEPNCEIKNLFQTGEIAETRYNSYFHIIEDIKEGKSHAGSNTKS